MSYKCPPMSPTAAVAVGWFGRGTQSVLKVFFWIRIPFRFNRSDTDLYTYSQGLWNLLDHRLCEGRREHWEKEGQRRPAYKPEA